jgi:hypothetical protein
MISQRGIATSLEDWGITEKNDPCTSAEGDIPSDLPNSSLISLTRKSPLKIYSVGFQPAKSIPEIPRWFLQKYISLPAIILDPFAGSGTTIIESIKYGASVYWLDYHPLSRLICTVKTTPYSSRIILEETAKVIEHSMIQKEITNTVEFSNRDFWFQKPVQEGLEILRENIFKSKLEVQPVLWLILAATVRKTSNMDDGMILAATRPNNRKIPQYTRLDVFKYFRIYADRITDAIAEWNNLTKDSLKNAKELPTRDARRLDGDWICDAVITSPPYINAMDYVWASKFELHWLSLIKNDKDRLNLYSKEIGTERIAKRECRSLGRTGNQYLDKLIEDIYAGKYYKASKGQNELRSRVVYQYFLDMKKHFIEVLPHIQDGGYYCFAVGDNSKICGVNIPVASILANMAVEIGFEKLFQFNLLLKNRRLNIPRNVDWAGTIKYDNIVVLKKPYS